MKKGLFPIILFLLIVTSVYVYSTNWSSDVLIVDNGVPTLQDPDLVTDASGDSHIVWWDERDGNKEIYYKTINKRGENITEEIRVSNSIGESQQPSVALDRAKNVHIAWDDNRNNGQYEIYYKKLGRNGENLTGEIRISNNPSYLSHDPQIKTDRAGNIHILWTDDRDGNNRVYYRKLDNDGNPLTPEKGLTQAESWASSLALDRKGDMHLTWVKKGTSYVDPYEVYYGKFDNDGNPLTQEIQLTSHPSASLMDTVIGRPSHDVDKKGNVHIVWADYITDWNCPSGSFCAELHYVKLNNNGVNLTEEKRLTYDKNASIQPSLVTDSCGDIHIGWRQAIGVPGTSEIYYMKLDNKGINLTGNTRLTFSPRLSEIPSISTDRNNNAFIVWQDYGAGTTSYYDWIIYGKRSIHTSSGDKLCLAKAI